MKRIICYILLVTGILCLQIRFALADNIKELSSKSSWLSAVGTKAGSFELELKRP